MRRHALALVASVLAGRLFALQPSQSEQDEYTQYELLASDSASFKIVYEVTATTPGAKLFFNPIRKGSIVSDEAVFDMMTGAPLQFEQVSGAEAKTSGLGDADSGSDYIRVHLARQITPDGGQARIRIIKTYKDPKSYYQENGGIVFDRPLSIRRNAIILPAGYWLTECNVPSQILAESDGKTRVSFMHQAPGPALLIVKAKPGAAIADSAKLKSPATPASWETPPSQPVERERLSERAHQDRDIVYFLQEPGTHSFALYHDYTETREGTDKYLNVVRTGSKVSNPTGKILDTGEALKVEVMTGAGLKSAKIEPGEEKIAPEQEVVVFRFSPLKKGQSIRLRMSETYTAPESYRLEGDELVFDRTLSRPRNSVILPRDWYVTALSIPGVVRQTPEGFTRIDFVNGRPDSIAVLLKAKKTRLDSALPVR
jgi:hypothetical protein